MVVGHLLTPRYRGERKLARSIRGSPTSGFSTRCRVDRLRSKFVIRSAIAGKTVPTDECPMGARCWAVAGQSGRPGRTARDNRLFVNGTLWVLRSVAHWHDLPERYGNWKRVHTRFSRWAKAGVQGPHRRSEERISYARHHPASRPPAGSDRKRGDQN